MPCWCGAATWIGCGPRSSVWRATRPCAPASAPPRVPGSRPSTRPGRPTRGAWSRTCGRGRAPDMRHALSFDVEEFFQVANLRESFAPERWDQVPSRLDVGMHAILAALARHDARATFFFLGWVAERRPDLVRACLAAGHEVASHGYEHRFLDELGEAGL